MVIKRVYFKKQLLDTVAITDVVTHYEVLLLINHCLSVQLSPQ